MFVFAANAAAQSTYSTYPLHEAFDLRNRTKVLAPAWNGCDIDPEDDAGTFGDGMAYVLESYISMYDATGDKAYLYKFMIETLRMLENRHDLAGVFSEQPYWSDDDDQPYLNGNIIGAMARFVHYVQELHPELTTVPLSPLSGITDSWLYWDDTSGLNCQSTPFNDCAAIGDFAHWLQYRVNETLDELITEYWIDDEGISRLPGEETAAEVNLQAGFTKAALFMGICNPAEAKVNMALDIAERCKSYISEYDACEEEVYSDYVLKSQSGNAVWWYHKSWSLPRRNCFVFPTWHFDQPDINHLTEFKEDIGHGSTVSLCLDDLEKYLPSSPVTSTDMVRLHNMFTKHVYDEGTGLFHSALDGTDSPVSPAHIDAYAPLGFAHLAPYDGWDESSADIPKVLDAVYEILMEFGAEEEIWESASSAFDIDEYTGAEMRGHADLMAIQWQRECFDLTLFNRDVVYDQNFAAKHVLTIDPSGGPGESFADPVISAPRFTVNEEVRTDLRAGAAIVLKPGFEAAYGSVLEAAIDPLGCTMEVRSTNGSLPTAASKGRAGDHMSESVSRFAGSSSTSSDLKVWPNPSTGTFTLQFRSFEAVNVQWDLINSMGQRLLHSSAYCSGNGVQELTIDGRSLDPGVYVLVASFNGRTERTPVVFDR